MIIIELLKKEVLVYYILYIVMIRMHIYFTMRVKILQYIKLFSGCLEYQNNYSNKFTENVIIKTIEWENHITKTRLYNFDPLKRLYYIVKLGFTGVYIIFFLVC